RDHLGVEHATHGAGGEDIRGRARDAGVAAGDDAYLQARVAGRQRMSSPPAPWVACSTPK
ncbi:MAG: hypothetical protein AAF928_09710, partial [Myxococcota bacterium]